MVRYLFIFVFLACINFTGLSQKINRFNKHGQRHGKWITYSDSAKTKKSVEGRYRKGEPKGRFYYYTMEGVLERREISRWGVLKTRLYYPDGTLRFKGQARIDDETDRIHYYFFGPWKYYDEQGRLLKYCYYEKGRLVKTVYADKKNKTSDSLISVLNELDTMFQMSNVKLMDSISMSRYNVQKREQLELELYNSDTLTFHRLDLIFTRFGYPSKERVHEAVIIPFYILSYAPSGIKEKYLPLLKAAADKGDIEWKSLAFYIDKIRIAKNEKQVYGTQFYIKGMKQIYYPIEDPDKLSERRTKVGL